MKLNYTNQFRNILNSPFPTHRVNDLFQRKVGGREGDISGFLPAAKPRRSMDGKSPPSGKIESQETFRGQRSMET